MEIVNYEGENYLRILNHDTMPPFLMSIVSDSDHWMFISSNGGLTAGRRNPEFSLFPYYTEDKLTESADITGSKSIFQIRKNGKTMVWEPFSIRNTSDFSVSRNLLKSIFGNKIMFEEINHDLGLKFSYQWCSSNQFGFVRYAMLQNNSDSDLQITLLDGIQNVLPCGVPSDLQRNTSNLVDAYKRTELEPASGAAIFSLSAIIVDKPEPSEALKANVAWALGVDRPIWLLSSLQLDRFRKNEPIQQESDIKGEKGAYFVVSNINLPSGSEKKWQIIAGVNQRYGQLVSLFQQIRENPRLDEAIRADVDRGTQQLQRFVAAADGLQCTADQRKDARHFSNVLFNIMRGGIFDHHYFIEKEDFIIYLTKASRQTALKHQCLTECLEAVFTLDELKKIVFDTDDADLIRLGLEYLPLQFSRRHGDPSRPWNYFSINTRHESDGSKVLDYEGNWRDLFQNWEALACSYPGFVTGMIFRFLNATTYDGYNPYRITKDGFDWETIEHDNPWSFIGYWGDHQIIYLLKLLEIAERYYPGMLTSFFDKDWFVFANVPYRIKPYAKIVQNPKDTVEFDHEMDKLIRKQRELLGADGALLTVNEHQIVHVNFLEKILASLLAKISNFIPDAGIWMNTQRPEWNDANNALVGNGASMVTLCYMYRYLRFFATLMESYPFETFRISNELAGFYQTVQDTLVAYSPLLNGQIKDHERKTILDRLGRAGSEYREMISEDGFSGEKKSCSIYGLRQFMTCCLDWFAHAIRVSQRSDKLFHAYKLVTISERAVTFGDLPLMLEGQVAVLSSGLLNAEEAVGVLDTLRNSDLFRADQHSYVLHSAKDLPGFLSKNIIPEQEAKSSELILKLASDGNFTIAEQDIHGQFHFNGNFKNASDLTAALNDLSRGEYAPLVQQERQKILDIFEKVFNHKGFTGRSGTFFAYEGLGSIYWHMVSKLHLAVQECYQKAINENADLTTTGKLHFHYDEIEKGIGLHKSPEVYGAFPTDPYSHTPLNKGARQPGMTGQVKEDILVHFGEMGIIVRDGCISFHPYLLKKEAFLIDIQYFLYFTIKGEKASLALRPRQLAFTFCQTPVIYSLSEKNQTVIHHQNGVKTELADNQLTREVSSQIFRRSGEIVRIEVFMGG